MKQIVFTLVAFLAFAESNAQDFNKYLATARTSYTTKNLDDARFAMQQMLQELDVLTGKEALKLLPSKLAALTANMANDNVTGNSGLARIMIQRDYGTGDKTAEIQIIGNSPLTASINAILSLPFGNSNGNQRTIRLDGYKALLQKHTDSESGKVSYEIQVPLNSSLLTLKANGLSEEEVQKLASAIPISKLASLIQ